MSRIGKPLVIETGKPRFNPKTLPLPKPITPVPSESPDKEPVKVGS